MSVLLQTVNGNETRRELKRFLADDDKQAIVVWYDEFILDSAGTEISRVRKMYTLDEELFTDWDTTLGIPSIRPAIDAVLINDDITVYLAAAKAALQV